MDAVLYHIDGFSLYHKGVALYRTFGTYDKYGNRVRVFYNYEHLDKVLAARLK